MNCIQHKAVIYTSSGLSCYLGKLEQRLIRSNVSPTLLISLDDALELCSDNGTPVIESQSLLIPSGADIHINTRGANLVQCFLDDLGINFSRLALSMKTIETSNSIMPVYYSLPQTSEIIDQGQYLLHARPENITAFDLIQNWLQQEPKTSTKSADARIVRVIEMIKQNYQENTSVATLAREVNLSVPRLIQLFKQTTGTPIRRFRLWHRIFATAHKLTEGQSLTEAAINAGFSDYAQFSRVYRELCGASPSAARNNTEIRLLR